MTVLKTISDHINLADLTVLALDCQATGANPDRGHLLEIGWIPGSAAASSTPEISSLESHLIRLQAQTSIPPVVQRITGISDTTMTRAVPDKFAWRRLRKAAQANAALNQSPLCPTVIHFARFEAPFLRQLHETTDPGTPFPLDIICTHAIAMRLLPGLPRRGIRALAGYLGHSMPELKRSADHALATLVIWKGMVELLQSRCNISSLGQLSRWLNTSQPPRRTKRAFPMNPEIRLSLPDTPGVYRMRRSNADILYIGKAKSLKLRVNSYFRSHTAHPEHILEMLSQARDIDYSLTRSALEAAVLESDEIKHHRPPYNKALRPDRRSLVFCTRDLKQRSTRCDRRFRIGPLPDDRLIDALEAFGTWLSAGAGLTDDLVRCGHLVLAVPPAHAPAIQCLKDGFDLFRGNHRRYLQNCSTLRIVTSLGAQFREKQLETVAGIETDADWQTENCHGPVSDEQEEEATGADTWTPAGVAGAIESMLMHGALLIRRARWYGVLSESCVAWAPAQNPDILQNLIAFENGRIGHRDVLRPGRKVPVPAAFDRSWDDRRKNFDLVTYDRMRVVTTELRRLVSKGRKIELRLGPKVSLTASELEKTLQWV